MPVISFLPFLSSVPSSTRLLLITLTLFSLGSALAHGVYVFKEWNDTIQLGEAQPWLVLSPGRSWMFPWTLLTAGWVEVNPVEFIISAAFIFISTRYLERVWGPREVIRFTLIVIVASNIIAFGLSWILAIALGMDDMIYGPPIQGLQGLQAGFLVAFTQLIPEHQIQLLGKFKIKVKALPGIALLISNVLVIFRRQNPYILPQFGFFVAWVYLRFFKLSENGEFRGDRSETFAFQYWFPPPIRPVISKLSNFVFKMAVRLGVVKPWDEAATSSYQMLPGPGGNRAEAERRRALALKALDARVANAPLASTSTTAPPAATSQTAAAAATPAAPEASAKTADASPVAAEKNAD